MKALILCDRESLSFQDYNLSFQVQTTVEKSDNETHIITLNGDEIKPCVGCFGCWFKTPGQCVMTTDCANLVAKREIQSDVLVILSKITYGGFSYDIKSFLDRSILIFRHFLMFLEVKFIIR
jgi:multimeric flavodoxin WrbA